MTIDTSTWKLSTKRIAGFITAAGAAWQVPQVHDFAIAQVHAHPHWTGATALITALWALVHNPDVDKQLGIDLNEKRGA